MAAQVCADTQPAVGRPEALHGCRQFVLRGVALSCLTNAIHAGVSLAGRARLGRLGDWPPFGRRRRLAVTDRRAAAAAVRGGSQVNMA